MKATWLGNLLVLAAMSAASLFGLDLALWALAPPAPAPFMLKGMLRADRELEHVLTPGFRAHFEDEWARGEIAVNSRGQRDAEPTPLGDGVRRWLLIGDSFAFGQRLDQSETIDAFVEKLSGGRIDAYNAGVPGYGPPNILGALERLGDLSASRVVYLFFQNDLLAGEQTIGGETVVDGWPVKARDENGRPYTEDELREKVASAGSRSTLGDVLSLRHLRAAVSRLGARGADAPSDEAVAQAVATTAEMRELATSRGQSFAVAVIPSLAEVSRGEYDRYTRSYVARLRADGFALIEPLPALLPQDYLAGDGHLARSGAEKLARAVVDSEP